MVAAGVGDVESVVVEGDAFGFVAHVAGVDEREVGDVDTRYVAVVGVGGGVEVFAVVACGELADVRYFG